MRRLLKQTKKLADKILGNKSDEWFWRFRHFFDRSNWPEKYISEESLKHPHRKLLMDIIFKYAPFESVFEIGCASGPNLYLLAKKFPGAEILGSDISQNAVDFGKKWFEKQNIKNVKLFQSYAENSFKNFPDKSIDIIITDAALIYLNSDKLEKMIKEMTRVGRKALVFNEQHTDTALPISDGHWIHNYKSLLKKFVSDDKIKFTKIPEDFYGGNWAKYGYIIEVNIS